MQCHLRRIVIKVARAPRHQRSLHLLPRTRRDGAELVLQLFAALQSVHILLVEYFNVVLGCNLLDTQATVGFDDGNRQFVVGLVFVYLS